MTNESNLPDLGALGQPAHLDTVGLVTIAFDAMFGRRNHPLAPVAAAAFLIGLGVDMDDPELGHALIARREAADAEEAGGGDSYLRQRGRLREALRRGMRTAGILLPGDPGYREAIAKGEKLELDGDL